MKFASGHKSRLRTLIREAGVAFELSEPFYREAVLSLNANQGRTGEFLVQATVLDILREQANRKAITIPETQRVLNTPSGVRRIDLYFPESRFGVEIKSGYVRATKAFRNQVLKDVWLVEHRGDLLAEVMWIFLRGATSPARTFLDRKHVAWMDIDLDNARPPVTSARAESAKTGKPVGPPECGDRTG
jgi:hypothetical protein